MNLNCDTTIVGLRQKYPDRAELCSHLLKAKGFNK
jgi:hypothetical protein